MNLKNLVRKNVVNFTPYTSGEQPSNGDWIKLNSNENPYPPISEIMEDLKNAINDNLRKYPDPLATQVRKLLISNFLKKKYNITNPDSIFIGNGSDDILEVIFKTFIDVNDGVVFFNPSYAMYPVLTDLYNGKAIKIDLDENFDIPDSKLDLKGKLFIINSPNNPSGKSFSNETILKLSKNFPGIIIIDEAYADFSKQSALSIASRIDNMIVIRTFSKSFSLASLRMAFAVANPDIVQELNKVKLPFNTNYMAQAAAISCLKNIDKIFSRNNQIIEQREFLIHELNKFEGIKVFPSDANFVLIKFSDEEEAKKYLNELKNQKILVRYFNKNGLKSYIRVTIGKKEENLIFLKAFNQIYNKSLNN